MHHPNFLTFPIKRFAHEARDAFHGDSFCEIRVDHVGQADGHKSTDVAFSLCEELQQFWLDGIKEAMFRESWQVVWEDVGDEICENVLGHPGVFAVGCIVL